MLSIARWPPCRLPLAAVALWLLASRPARGEEEPRLVLPGSHTVTAGQRVALEWTAADGISELEILLSLDGGRTYPIWVSPRLAPGDRRFVWRVPAYGGRSLRMRIRYNRGGREIEGAPTSSIAVVPGVPEPLGLPPPPAAPAPPRGDEGGPTSPPAARACREAPAEARPRGRLIRLAPNTDGRAAADTPPPAGVPSFVPLRA